VWEAARPRQKDQTESSVECCCSRLVTTSTKLCSPLSSRSLDGAANTGIPLFSIFYYFVSYFVGLFVLPQT
jgi:hypothetical protein